MTGLLDGKVAIVTGAGHGIGRGHALELAKQGARIVVNDLGTSVKGEGSGRDADTVVDIIKARGGQAIPDYADVGDEDQVEAMVAKAWSEFGRADILVNNAGIVRDKAIWNMPAADFDIVMRVHVRGTWLASRAVARRWREEAKSTGSTYGRIINTVSGAGLLGHFGQSNYATAKSAIAGLTLTTSLELASTGVTVNAIGPGGLTRISATMPGQAAPLEPDERPEGEYDPQDPSNCSPVVAWLASPEAGHVSGQVIRAMEDKIYLMGGWTEDAVVANGEKRWDATKLGQVFATDVFKTRAPGLRFG